MNINEALIIGGSSGIGKDVANKLLQRGLSVTLVARDAQKLNSTMEELSTRGQVNSRTVGLYDPDAAANLCNEIPAQSAPIHCLLSAASWCWTNRVFAISITSAISSSTTSRTRSCARPRRTACQAQFKNGAA